MINVYYYNKQLKNYIIQFANIFAGLGVKTGKGEDGTITDLEVPIVYGSKDRVVASIGAGNTQNRLHTLPIMSCYMSSMELVPERRHGNNGVARRSYLKQGGVFPDDIKVAYQIMPVPYDLMFDVGIYTSNTDQAFQVLEQLLIIFDPTLQIQTTEATLDWTKLVNVELMSMANEETYPSGTEKRIIIWNLNFKVQAWLTPPMEIRDNIVQKIIQRYGDLEGFTLYEYDQAGEPQVFGDGSLWTESEIVGDITIDP